MSPTQSKKPSQPNYNSDNFLEAFRDLGKSFINDAKSQLKQAVTTDLTESFGFGSLTGGDSKAGDLKPNESFSLSDVKQAKKEGFDQAQQAFESQLAQLRREGELRFQKEQSAVRQQIKQIQDDVKSMAKSVGQFAQEVEIATIQSTVNPGVYQKNFFLHLRAVIMSLRQRADSSRNWLAAHNSRASKKGYFWGQVKKSGTSYLLSGERYAVTSTG